MTVREAHHVCRCRRHRIPADIRALDLAEEWDNVGLLLGDSSGSARRVMTCLTVTPATADEAVEAEASLIVTHHPVLFRAAKRITAGNSEGKMLLSLIRAGVAVYSPHTAFDNTRGGINDLIAGWLGLANVKPLRPGRNAAGPTADKNAVCKVVVFVPEKDLHKVADAMFAAARAGSASTASAAFASLAPAPFSVPKRPTPRSVKKGGAKR